MVHTYSAIIEDIILHGDPCLYVRSVRSGHCTCEKYPNGCGTWIDEEPYSEEDPEYVLPSVELIIRIPDKDTTREVVVTDDLVWKDNTCVGATVRYRNLLNSKGSSVSCRYNDEYDSYVFNLENIFRS